MKLIQYPLAEKILIVEGQGKLAELNTCTWDH